MSLPSLPEGYMPLREFARHVGISEHYLRKLIREGKLPAKAYPYRRQDKYIVPASASSRFEPQDVGAGNDPEREGE